MFGAGGIGKTSVAVTVAAGFESVEWIDAEPLDRARAVSAALLDRLDPLPLGDRTPTLRALLDGRRLLVVIDGAEGLGEDLSGLVRDFPASPEGPWLLVTSRLLPSAVDLPVVRLEPLDVDGRGTEPPDAIVLFHDRYVASGGTPELLAHHASEIRRLALAAGGIPAVLTLVAARASLVGFEPSEDAVEHPSADAVFDTAIARSLRLLDPDSVHLLLGMGSTADQIPRGLAAALSGLPPDRLEAALETLSRHALITPARQGLAMLPPVRRSVRRHACRAGTAPAADEGHRRWCLALATGPAASTPGALVAAEAEIRTAIGRSVAYPDGLGDAVAMAVALAQDFPTVLQHRRALELLESVLEMAEQATPDDLIRLLSLAASVSSPVNGAAGATPLIERAEALLPGAEEAQVHRARLLCLRAELDFDAGDLVAAANRAGEARALASRAGAKRIELRATKALADISYESGKLDDADRLAAEVAAGVPEDLAWLGGMAAMLRGMCAVERGAYAVATSAGRAELERCRQTEEQDGAQEAAFVLVAADPVGNRDLITAELATIGDTSSWVAHLQLKRCYITYHLLDHEFQAASLMAADAAVIAETLPHRWEQIEANLLLGDASTAASDLPQALYAYGEALTAAVERGSVLRAADALDGFAAALATIDPAAGRAAAGAAQLVRQAHRAAPRPRPWLSGAGAAGVGRVPAGWVQDGKATFAAVVALRQVVVSGPASDDGRPLARLSRSELAVAELIAAGRTNREIGELLHISRRTVETHVAHAFQKLGLRTRAHLAAVVTAAAR